MYFSIKKTSPMLKKFSILIIIVFSISCSTTRITTTNLHDLVSFEAGGNIYALPQTRLMYTVTVVNSTFMPGPYCDYAKRFLGIDGVQKLPKAHWQIEDIDLCRITEPDPDHFYSIKTEGKNECNIELEGLQKEGLLLLPASLHGYQIDYNNRVKPVIDIKHSDLSVKPFYRSKGSSARRGSRDTLNTRLPVYKDDLKSKSAQEKAKEAADFIIKIRKRRFKLLAGQYEVFPEGIALETSVRELNKLEEEYLSLFVGSVSTDTIYKIFTYVPVGNEKIQRTTLFKFSESAGFLSPNSPNGESVVVEITDLEKTSTLSQLQLPVSATSYSDIVFYRLPDRATIKTRHGSHLIHEAEISVCQFGTLVPKYIEPKSKSILQKQ